MEQFHFDFRKARFGNIGVNRAAAASSIKRMPKLGETIIKKSGSTSALQMTLLICWFVKLGFVVMPHFPIVAMHDIIDGITGNIELLIV